MLLFPHQRLPLSALSAAISQLPHFRQFSPRLITERPVNIKLCSNTQSSPRYYQALLKHSILSLLLSSTAQTLNPLPVTIKHCSNTQPSPRYYQALLKHSTISPLLSRTAQKLNLPPPVHFKHCSNTQPFHPFTSSTAQTLNPLPVTIKPCSNTQSSPR